jgi:hypothetical protein
MTTFDNRSTEDLTYPNQLREAEEYLIRQRPGRAADPHGAIGVGLSGGGIRSATFCLGVFQAFANLRLLDKLDFISSVSGGGFFASFYGRLFTRPEVVELKQVEEILSGDQSLPLNAGTENWMRKTFRWLRENGRYLAPGGAGDFFFDLAIVIRNLASLYLVMALFLLTIFATAQSVGQYIQQLDKIALFGIGKTYRDIYLSLPAFAGFRWSPYFVVAIAMIAFLLIPLTWAFWLVADWRENPFVGFLEWPWAWSVPLLVILFTILPARVAHVFGSRFVLPKLLDSTQNTIWLITGLAVLFALVAISWAVRFVSFSNKDGLWRRVRRPAPAFNVDHWNVLTIAVNWLSVAFKNVLITTLSILAFAIIDSLGFEIYSPKVHWRVLLASLLTGAGAGSLGKWAVSNMADRLKKTHVRLPVRVLAGLVAAIIIIPILVVLNAVSHAIAINVKPPSTLAAVVAMMLCFTMAVGRMRGFLNTSTLSNFYSSRLSRAYLGASNVYRLRESGRAMDAIVSGDDISQEDYWSPVNIDTYKKGAPIHLVNVTVNETYGGYDEVEQQDRKGLGMAIGPAAISVGTKDHVVFQRPREGDVSAQQIFRAKGRPSQYTNALIFPSRDEARVFEYSGDVYAGQLLPLSRWAAISGAAVSPGLGSRTSLGLSLLMGLFNVRLGYWWDSGTPSRKPEMKISGMVGRGFQFFFPVYRQLLSEFLSRFPGTSERYWYLTDGGHFENMGCYELVRRRLPLIILIDAEEDENYLFSDLIRLIQKARLDFGAELEFLDCRQLDELLGPPGGSDGEDSTRQYFGTLDQLRRGKWSSEEVYDPGTLQRRRSLIPDKEGLSLAHAAMAKIRYRGGTRGWMIAIKPTLTGDESADVLQYHRENPTFPHENTANQFFSESQWEGYRNLGEHIAMKVFGSSAGHIFFDSLGRM